MGDKTEPESKADLYRMLQTSSGWFDGQIEYKGVRNVHDTPTVGMVDSESTHVTASPYQEDDVVVYRQQHVISEIRGPSSFSLDTKRIWTRLMTFDEFKASEWWEPTITKFAGGSCDASEIFVTCDETDDDGGIGPNGYVHITAQCERHYHDWLDNSRLDKGFDKVSLWLQGNGDMGVTVNGETYELSVSELAECIKQARAFAAAGIKLEDGVLSVTLPKRKDKE